MEVIKIIIENFKGIKRVELDPIKPINVLIGRNNSGKSSVLQALECLGKHKIITLKNNQRNTH